MTKLKEQYHSFSNENRTAEVFLEVIGSERNWSIDCFEHNEMVVTYKMPYEVAAEQLADEWVMGDIKIIE